MTIEFCKRQYRVKQSSRNTTLVEKLQEITVDDALHEGCSIFKGLESFKKLWNKIVFDKITYGWDANPFVWVYTFERINEVR